VKKQKGKQSWLKASFTVTEFCLLLPFPISTQENKMQISLLSPTINFHGHSEHGIKSVRPTLHLYPTKLRNVRAHIDFRLVSLTCRPKCEEKKEENKVN
jgi:hypothetical protein